MSEKEIPITVFKVTKFDVDDVNALRWKQIVLLVAHNIGQVAWAVTELARAVRRSEGTDG